MRIGGFTDRGEVRIVDDEGRLVGYGELRLEDAHLTGIERGDRFALEVVVTWTRAELPEPELPDPDELDFDGLDWDTLLPGS